MEVSPQELERYRSLLSDGGNEDQVLTEIEDRRSR